MLWTPHICDASCQGVEVGARRNQLFARSGSFSLLGPHGAMLRTSLPICTNRSLAQGQGLGTSMVGVSASLSVSVDWAMISTLCPMGLIAETTTT